MKVKIKFTQLCPPLCTPVYDTATAAKSLQPCPTLCDPIDGSPPGSPVPGILQNTGVGCQFLLQCMKVKSESKVVQSCPTLSDPVDCSLPGSSVHGFSRQEYWSGCHCLLRTLYLAPPKVFFHLSIPIL